MIEETVRHIYELLYQSKYTELMELTGRRCLGEDQISQTLSSYGHKLSPYPEHIVLDVVEIMEARPKEYNVLAPIYTEDEGLSELCLELQLIENQEGKLRAEIDGIHPI